MNKKMYESMILCPDTDAGYLALHEAIQEGWEIIFHWIEPGKEPINHFVMRRTTARSFQVGYIEGEDE